MIFVSANKNPHIISSTRFYPMVLTMLNIHLYCCVLSQFPYTIMLQIIMDSPKTKINKIKPEQNFHRKMSVKKKKKRMNEQNPVVRKVFRFVFIFNIRRSFVWFWFFVELFLYEMRYISKGKNLKYNNVCCQSTLHKR